MNGALLLPHSPADTETSEINFLFNSHFLLGESSGRRLLQADLGIHWGGDLLALQYPYEPVLLQARLYETRLQTPDLAQSVFLPELSSDLISQTDPIVGPVSVQAVSSN